MFKQRRWIIQVILMLLYLNSVDAQCAMCRAVLESEVDQSAAEGINNGIVYLMAMPYILVGGVAYFIYRKLKRG